MASSIKKLPLETRHTGVRSSGQMSGEPVNIKLLVLKAIEPHKILWDTPRNRLDTPDPKLVESEWKSVADHVHLSVMDCKKEFRSVQKSFKNKIGQVMRNLPNAKIWRDIDSAVKGEKKNAAATVLALWNDLEWLVESMAMQALKLRNDGLSGGGSQEPVPDNGEQQELATASRRKRNHNDGKKATPAKKRALIASVAAPSYEDIPLTLGDVKQEIVDEDDEDEGLTHQSPPRDLNCENNGFQASSSPPSTGNIDLKAIKSEDILETLFCMIRVSTVESVKEFPAIITKAMDKLDTL